MDFNSADEQRSPDLIPAGTILPLHLTIRPGGAGDGGWTRRSKDGQSEGLDCEFGVTEGEFAKRKFWGLFTVSGTTEGHTTAGKISASKIRAILESARGVRPDDKSETAIKARHISGYAELDGLRFWGKVGVTKSTDGFEPKNILAEVITPDKKAWRPITQVVPAINPAEPGKSAAPVVASKPEWAF